MKRIKLVITILISSFLITINSFAQIDNTMYFMDRLPQANLINPSTYPECKFYFSGLVVPIFGQLPPPITIALNTPLDYNDFIFHGRFGSKDSLITPLHPDANLDDFLKKLKDVNYFTTDFQLTLASFGFKQEKNFWSFDASERMFINLGIPGNLIKLPILGNGTLRDADLTGLHLNMFYYHQLSFGYKRQITKYFNVGGHIKFLTGVANIYSSQNSINLITAQNSTSITTKSNYTIHTNAPINVFTNDQGIVDSITFKEFSDDIKTEIKKNAIFTHNRGIAIDAGFSKDWNSELTYYFNIEDLGFINWNTNVNTLSVTQDDGFAFQGLHIVGLGADNRELPTLDTILKTFEFSHNTNSYRTPLPYKLYGGVRYKFTQKIYGGLVGRFEKLSYGFRPSVSASVNFRPFKYGLLTFSYSYINRNLNNMGIGFTSRIGPIQWFFVSDNIIGTAIFPDNSRSISMRMGCNFIFRDEKDKPKRALPMFNGNNNYTNRKIPKFGEITGKSLYKKKSKKFKTISAPQN